MKAWELIQQIKESRKGQRWKKGDIVKNKYHKPLEVIGIENDFVVTADTYGNRMGNLADDLEMICQVELRFDN
ncbi:hypothetical protein ABEV41_00755 [Geobacillus thermodenitrificans]|uniref:hypothetical protein n=1 Tax=Geobacillus thermodenitrificans TaxID=33940 RepID=UPI003D24708A